MPKQTITLISPYPVEECRRRLKENFGSLPFPELSSKDLIGAALPGSFAIRKRISVRNIFQKRLSGSYYQTPEGTIITGSFGLDPFAWLFLIIWYGILALITGVLGFLVVVGEISLSRLLFSNIERTLIILLVYIFPIIFMVLDRIISKDDFDFLKDYLIRLLEAKEVDVQPADTAGQG